MAFCTEKVVIVIVREVHEKSQAVHSTQAAGAAHNRRLAELRMSFFSFFQFSPPAQLTR